MGVPTSKVGYTSATTGSGDHKSIRDTWWPKKGSINVCALHCIRTPIIYLLRINLKGLITQRDYVYSAVRLNFEIQARLIFVFVGRIATQTTVTMGIFPFKEKSPRQNRESNHGPHDP
jgi:hypothetical protein